MTLFNPELIVALSEKLDSFPLLKGIVAKHNITLFNVFSPAMIVNIDRAVSANPFVCSEAVSFLEMVTHLSLFYAEDGFDYVESCIGVITKSRTSWVDKSLSNSNMTGVSQSELMGEYFVNSTNDMAGFIARNPMYLGLYIYVMTQTTIK